MSTAPAQGPTQGSGCSASNQEIEFELRMAIKPGQGAAAEFLPLVYKELRRLAAKKLAGEKPGQTLDATGLVHEAYLRLIGPDEPRGYQNQQHFFLAAAQAMRRILVDKARHKATRKRGGGLARRELADLAAASPAPELVA